MYNINVQCPYQPLLPVPLFILLLVSSFLFYFPGAMCYPACPPDVLRVFPTCSLSLQLLCVCVLTFPPWVLTLLVLIGFLLFPQQLLLPLQSLPLALVLARSPAGAVAGEGVVGASALQVVLHVVCFRDLRFWRRRGRRSYLGFTSLLLTVYLNIILSRRAHDSKKLFIFVTVLPLSFI